MRSHIQSRKLVHVSGIHCHVWASSTSGCAFVYFTVQYCIEYSSTVSLFQAQDVGIKRKSSGDVAGTAKKRQLLYCTTVLLKVLYCNIKSVFFILCVCLFFMYYLCEKYYKPITIQYYIAGCVSWVPRLTLLDLTNKLDLRSYSRNGTRSYVGDLLHANTLWK